ncbi:MAG: HAD-IC family P-type ATPase [Candidatus Pacebacteria bacterium]|nr:HAD-IC family P-type ATPase [Candidatus Paceibacterota bacterium]
MITNQKEIWYSFEKKDLEKTLNTNLKKGLSQSQVLENREKYGSNILEKEAKKSFLFKILLHIKSPLNLILIIAGIIAMILGHFLDTLVIFVAVIINLIVGIIQEDKADEAFEKLNTAQKKTTVVLREGKQKVIPIENLVVGDIVILTAGIYVPADVRIIKGKNLLVNESVLTGEWIGVMKNEKVLYKEKVSTRDQSNMLWMGTSISAGYGNAVVVRIGSDTELGSISKEITEFERVTPMKRKMNRLVRFLTITVFVATISIFLLGIFKGETYTDMFLVAIAVAISIIPEGLPIATTSVLAVGMKEILKKGGLVKNLLASETLGNVSVILTDKTGTITEAKMKLDNIFTIKNSDEEKGEVLKMAITGSDAFIEREENGELIIHGRPLEKAIVSAGWEKGFSQDELKRENKRIDFLSFSSIRGFAISLNEDKKIYIGGNPEVILAKSKFVLENDKKRKITKKDILHFKRLLNEKTNQGMRLTAVAYKDVNWKKIKDESPDELVFGGLLAFNDPIRKDVKESVNITKELGVRTIMLTGDNAGTARKIAEEAGIIKEGEWVLKGEDIDKMGDIELEEVLDKINVFARMSPSQKLRVSKILKKKGEIIAMTGDGINDAPALRNANVGIAVESGTEVAKESADMILLDNSFSVIVFAIEEGRRIIDNLKKIVSYLLSTSFSEVFVIGGALFFGLPLPILASQILYINIIEEGFMNFAFVFEPKEKYSKSNGDHLAKKEILNTPLRKMILTISLITGTFLIGFYFLLTKIGLPLEEIRTIMFVALSIDSLFFAISLKSFYKPIWKIKIFSNKYLIYAWFLSILMIILALYVPFLQIVLHTTPLKGLDFLIIMMLGIFNLFLIEIAKYFFLQKREDVQSKNLINI